MMNRVIEVVDYDPAWIHQFQSLRARVAPVVGDLAVSIEHVGSTSVPGLAAKPIIDMTIVVRDTTAVEFAIQRLASIGYVHRGNLGVEGREAFAHPPELPRHHLYLCPLDSPGLANHLAVRDHLRSNPDAAHAYGVLKRELARRFPNDIDAYVDGKTDFILAILRAAGFRGDRIASIEAANRVNISTDSASGEK